MNQIVLVGRLTKDAELSFLPNTGTPKATFVMAIDRGYKKQDGTKETDFIPVEFMGKVAENTAKFCGKGSLVGVIGSLRIDRYNDNEGNNRTFTKVFGNSIQFLSNSKEKADAGASASFTPSFGLDPNGFQALQDDDIPF